MILTGSDHGPYIPRYDLQAYSSIAVIDASGVFLMILFYEISLIPIFLILRKIFMCWRCVVKRLTNSLDGLRWGVIIRSLIEAYLELYLFSLLNLTELKFNNMTEFISSSLSLGFSGLLTFFPFGFLTVLNKPMKTLQD